MEWISTKDRLPDINTWVMVFGHSCISFACMYVHEEGDILWGFLHSNWAWDRIQKNERWTYERNDTTRSIGLNGINRSLDAIDITHWMPIPQPPKE